MFTWSGKRHITDVRTGDYLGFNDSATIDLPSYKAKLLCLLPYRVMRVNVEGPATVNRGDHVSLQATVETDGEAPGEHVLYFEVTSPTGARRPLYCKTRTAPEGRAELTIPLALNDPAGEWMVMVRDVMTGAEGRISALIRRSSQ